MGFITDILKEVPLSAVLREKLGTAEAEAETLKTENANLRESVKQKDAEIERLKKEIERLTKPQAGPSIVARPRQFRRGDQDGL